MPSKKKVVQFIWVRLTMKVDADKLWEKYSKQKDKKTRDELIVHFAYLVKITAGKMFNYFDRTVDYSELEGYGIFGLIDAIDKYDASKNVKFETYATYRIRGEIYDQIRKTDWVPRVLRQRQKEYDKAVAKFNDAGIPVTAELLSKELGITMEALDTLKCQMHQFKLVSWEAQVDAVGNPKLADNGQVSNPEEDYLKKELTQKLQDSMSKLLENERKVILMYYYEDLTMLEISKVINVSESRISQLHKRALDKMRKLMGDYMDLLVAA